MTFYWWSHWFWITSSLYFLLFADAYPSLEQHQNIKTVATFTKLNRTIRTDLNQTALSTAIADIEQHAIFSGEPFNNDRKMLMQKVVDQHDGVDQFADDYVELEEEEEEEEQQQQQQQQQQLDDDKVADIKEMEFKRSALSLSSNNGTEQVAKISLIHATAVAAAASSIEAAHERHEEIAAIGANKLQRYETDINNFTNFSSDIANATSTNKYDNNDTNVQLDVTIVNSTTTSVNQMKGNKKLEWLPPLVTDSADVMETLATTSHRAPFTLENVNKEEELRRAENEHRSRKSKVLSSEYAHINRHAADQKSVLTRSASTAPYDLVNDTGGNISSEPLSSQGAGFLDASAIIAICFTVFGVCCTIGTIGILLYRRRYLNKPQTLSEPDSSVYIDDSTMRDNSDEMYSLDNDSFLNSLEAMTIQNYWTDTVKHTKL